MDRFAFAGVIGFSLGILVATLYDGSWLFVWYAVFLSALLATLYFSKRASVFLLVSVCLLGAAVGIGRTAFVPTTIASSFASLVGTETEIEGVVVADPDLREQTQRLTVEITEEEETTRILVVAPLVPEVRYGERITAFGSIEAPEPFETDGGRTFRYDQFLSKDGIFAIMSRATIEVVGEREGVGHMRGALSDIKVAGLNALSVALHEPHGSLAGGLILGGKQGLGEDLLNDFIRSGLVHIVVLSGYNVMIVADFIMRIFSLFAERIAAPAAGISIVLFVLAAGAGPASIRAGIMACIALYGRATGRTYDAFRALLLAGALMLLWNPLTLVHDPGFQLSFIATLGLIFGAPIVERYLAFIRSGFLKEIVASTLAAQIAVLPLLLYQNGLFSVVALPANILVLPLVPLAMLFSALAGVAGLLVPVAAPALGFPAYLLLSYITSVVTFTSNLPLAAFYIPVFPFWVVIATYVALIYTTCSRNRFSTTDQFTLSRNAST